MKIKNSTQQGTALIVALFIMALIASIAIAMTERLSIHLRSTELILRADQADFYTTGAVAWAKDQLNQAWKLHKNNQPVDRKSPVLFPVATEGPYTITGSLSDAQGLFNLNNVTDSQYQPAFIRLLQTVAKVDQTTAETITKALVDWVTPGLKETPYDAIYRKEAPPYRSAHRAMASVSELLLVNGITSDLFNRLLPYITALPTVTPININSAPPPVIMSLSPTLLPEAAQQLAMLCQQTPFVDLQPFLALDAVKNNQFPANIMTVTSNYFLLETHVTVDQQHLTTYTLLNRITKNTDSVTLTVWQSKGTL